MLSQRRDNKMRYVKAVKQIHTEKTLIHHFFEITICSANQSKIGKMSLGSSQFIIFVRFDNS